MSRNIDNIENKKSAQDIAAQVSRDMGNPFATHIDTDVFSSIFTDATITSAALGVTLTPIAVTTPRPRNIGCTIRFLLRHCHRDSSGGMRGTGGALQQHGWCKLDG